MRDYETLENNPDPVPYDPNAQRLTDGRTPRPTAGAGDAASADDAAAGFNIDDLDGEDLEMMLLRSMYEGYEEFGKPVLQEKVRRTYGLDFDEATGRYTRTKNPAANTTFNPDGSINYHEESASIQGVADAFNAQRPQDPNYNAGAHPGYDIAQARGEARAGTEHLVGQYGNALTEANNLAALATGGQQQQAANLDALAAQQSDEANQQAAFNFGRDTRNRGLVGSALGVGAALYNRFSTPTPSTFNLTGGSAGSNGLPNVF